MANLQARNKLAKFSHGRPQSEASTSRSPPKPDANVELLGSIKSVMDDLQTEIIAKFESIIAESVKKEVAIVLKPLEEKVAVQGGTILDLERAASEHRDQLTSMEANITELSAKVKSLSEKCEDLEARFRWNNIRLVGLPEGSQGPRPTEFMAEFLQNLLDLEANQGWNEPIAHSVLNRKTVNRRVLWSSGLPSSKPGM